MKKILLPIFGLVFLFSCNEQMVDDNDINQLKSGTSNLVKKESSTFTLYGTIDIGETGAAEISAFDPITKRLFVVNNTVNDDDEVLINQIEVVDFSNPASPLKLDVIDITGGKVNSLHVNQGRLAAAVEAETKTDNGKVIVYQTDNYSVIAEIEVGALPDMVTFSPDGKFIISANEGEPNDEYTIDPAGTISIISTVNYSVKTLDFGGFESRAAELKAKGFRIFGKNASFAQDIEPEYVAVSANSKKAWVTLQENNGIAVIDLNSKTITDILPLGFKNYNLSGNIMDLSDKDNGVFFKPWPVKGVYMPDGIAVMANNNEPFIFTANEGDARDYSGFSEIIRVNKSDVVLDPVAFPNAATIKLDENLGKLNITTTLGDKNGDGDFDELYSFGARSFSIWNGNTGKQIFDSGNMLDKTATSEGNYDDKRSDDKGSEPEGVEIGRVGNKNLLFVGLERADGVAVYDVTNPVKPKYLQWLDCGDAPEGLLFIPANESPSGKSLLVVSSEGDGVVTVFITE